MKAEEQVRSMLDKINVNKTLLADSAVMRKTTTSGINTRTAVRPKNGDISRRTSSREHISRDQKSHVSTSLSPLQKQIPDETQ